MDGQIGGIKAIYPHQKRKKQQKEQNLQITSNNCNRSIHSKLGQGIGKTISQLPEVLSIYSQEQNSFPWEVAIPQNWIWKIFSYIQSRVWRKYNIISLYLIPLILVGTGSGWLKKRLSCELSVWFFWLNGWFIYYSSFPCVGVLQIIIHIC